MTEKRVVFVRACKGCGIIYLNKTKICKICDVFLSSERLEVTDWV